MLFKRILNILLLWITILVLTIMTSASDIVSEITTPNLNSDEYTRESAEISEDLPVYAASGFFYTVEEKNATIIGCTDSSAAILSIPSEIGGYPVVRIGERAFYGMKSLLIVSISDGVMEIGAAAFSDCYNLTRVTIGDGVTSIWGSAFYKCLDLETVILGSSVRVIDGAAFRYCDKLKEIVFPKSVTTIGPYAFADCSSLTQLDIPDNVESVGSGAFYRCSKITDITIGKGLTEISTETFSYCGSLSKISIPQNIACVRENAFSYCSSLNEINLPDTLSSIEEYAFWRTGYYDNEENWIDNALYIDNYLIKVRDFSVTEYEFSPKTIGIAEQVFSSCDSLTSITLPAGLKYISEGVFEDCQNLKYVIIGDALESIDSLAFSYCVSLTDVYYEGTTEMWNAISIGNGNTSLTDATLHCLGGKACKIIFNTQDTHSFFVMAGMGTTVSEPDVSYRVGYFVDGWYTDETYTNAYDFEVPVTGPMVLYAHWSACTVVTLDARGGTVTPKSINVAVNSTYGELPTPVRSGYTFDGWYTSIYSDIKITNETVVNQPADHSLYAHWTANTYVVAFDACGGIVGLPSMEVTYYDYYGELPTPTRNGYSFIGWYTEIDGGDKVTGSSDRVKIIADHTLYAHWEANSYYLKFNANGGGFTSGTSKTVTCDTPVGELPTPKWIDHFFEGWYTAAVGGDKVTSETIATYELLSKSLYAHWAVIVTFDANQGVVDTRNMRVTVDSAYAELPIPTRIGYIFNGWYTARDGGEKVISGTTACPRSNHSLYAHWTINDNVVVVSFKANGGTINASNREVTKGTAYGELPIPSRNGYTFAGWYTAANGGERITSETIVSTADEQLSAQILYAHWLADTYHVKFDVNGGQAQEFDKMVTCDALFGELPIPVRTGYTFDGWYTAATGGRKVFSYTTASYSLLSGTLYAHWVASSYTVSFNTNSASASPDSITVTYGSVYGALPAVDRQGYVFNGWYTAAIGGEQVTEDSVVSITENQELYAHWTTAIVSAAILEHGETSTTIRLSGDTEILKDDVVIFAACYDKNGKMTDGAFGSFYSETADIVFAKKVGTNWAIFFLESNTLTPYFNKTLLT